MALLLEKTQTNLQQIYFQKCLQKVDGIDSCSCEANTKVDFNLICSISNLFLCIYEKVPDLSSKPSILLYPVIVFK